MEESLRARDNANLNGNITLPLILQLKSLFIFLRENRDSLIQKNAFSYNDELISHVMVYIEFVVGCYNRNVCNSEYSTIAACLFQIDQLAQKILSSFEKTPSSTSMEKPKFLAPLTENLKKQHLISDKKLNGRLKIDENFRFHLQLTSILVSAKKSPTHTSPLKSIQNNVSQFFLGKKLKGVEGDMISGLMTGDSIKDLFYYLFYRDNYDSIYKNLKWSKIYLLYLSSLVKYQLDPELYKKIIRSMDNTRPLDEVNARSRPNNHYAKIEKNLLSLAKSKEKKPPTLDSHISTEEKYLSLRQFFFDKNLDLNPAQNLIDLLCKHVIQTENNGWVDMTTQVETAFSLIALGFLLNHPVQEDSKINSDELLFQTFWDFMQNLLSFYQKADNGLLWIRLGSLCRNPNFADNKLYPNDLIYLKLLESVVTIFNDFVSWPSLKKNQLERLELFELLEVGTNQSGKKVNISIRPVLLASNSHVELPDCDEMGATGPEIITVSMLPLPNEAEVDLPSSPEDSPKLSARASMVPTDKQEQDPPLQNKNIADGKFKDKGEVGIPTKIETHKAGFWDDNRASAADNHGKNNNNTYAA